MLCRDHLQSWELLLPTRFLQEGLGSSCHNKTAAGSLRDSQDRCQGQAGAHWNSSSQGKAPLSPDKEPSGHRQSLSSVYKLSDTIKTLREKEDGLEAAWAAEGRGYLHKKLVFKEVGVGLQQPRNSWLWVHSAPQG